MRAWYWNCLKKDSANFMKMRYTMNYVSVQRRVLVQNQYNEKEDIHGKNTHIYNTHFSAN